MAMVGFKWMCHGFLRTAAQRLLGPILKILEALTVASFRIRRSPHSTGGAIRQAFTEIEQGRFHAAVVLAHAAIASDPTAIEGYWALGLARSKLGESEQAQAAYNSGLRVEPQSHQLLLALADLEFEQKNYKTAEDLYKQALVQTSLQASGELLLRLAISVDAQSRTAEAFDLLNQARQREPSNDAILCVLGWTLLEQNRYLEAVAVLQEAIRLNSKRSRAHHYLGFALAKLGRHSEAMEQATMAVELSPDDQEIRTFVADLQQDISSRIPGPM
jgi:tetratricopeptide (TPR) repeat protein